MITLYPHQEEGKRALLENKKFCLFYGLGAGKTLLTLSALSELPPSKVLILAPKKVIDNVWLVENRIDISKHDITYLNYEKYARSRNTSHLVYDVIVLDEVHRIKGVRTKTSKRVRTMAGKAKYVWGLTGTPVANNYVDVYHIYNNMTIQEFYENEQEFLWKYYITRVVNVFNSKGYNSSIRIPVVARQQTLPELMERIGKHCLVKRTEDVVELPEQSTKVVYVDGMVTQKYKELSQGIIKTDDYEDTMIKLEALNKMHQASNGYFYDRDKKPIQICENKKLAELKDILVDLLAETERVIIVYQYKKDLDDLKTLPYKMTTDPSEFMDNQIYLMQFGQSEGLNLQYCNKIIFYTYDYSYINYEQITGRIYRNGQKRNVGYIVMIARNTIEEKIWYAIEHKQTADEYLKGALSNG